MGRDDEFEKGLQDKIDEELEETRETEDAFEENPEDRIRLSISSAALNRDEGVHLASVAAGGVRPLVRALKVKGLQQAIKAAGNGEGDARPRGSIFEFGAVVPVACLSL